MVSQRSKWSLLSKKSTALIHLFPAEAPPAGMQAALQVVQELIETLDVLLPSVAFQPEPESLVERGLVAMRDLAGLLDQRFLGGKSNILHHAGDDHSCEVDTTYYTRIIVRAGTALARARMDRTVHLLRSMGRPGPPGSMIRKEVF